MGLQRAARQGQLDLLFEYLERQVKDAQKAIPVDGPEWPLKRAFRDGQLQQAMDIAVWLTGRCKASPDGAENTEG